jgi:hypothetical protein
VPARIERKTRYRDEVTFDNWYSCISRGGTLDPHGLPCRAAAADHRMTLMNVPVIDIGPYFSNDPAGKIAVARQIDQACRDIGFLVITGHGVSKPLAEKVYALSRQFFDLPVADKMK